MDDDLTESVELEAYFAALHDRFAVHADAPVGAGLAEFVDVIDLTPVSLTAATSPTNSRRPKMLTGIGAFIATTTGKIVLGTTVAAASVGGMHAAEIVDVPLLPDQAKAEVLMVDVEEEATDSPEVEGFAAAPEADGEEAGQVEAAAAVAEGDGAEAENGENGDEEEPKNHGAVVSDFAKNTTLEGCEKGQAVSALARSKEKKKDADSEDETEVEAEELVEEEEETSKCKSKEDKEKDAADLDDDDDEEDDEDEDEDGDGPPEGKGHNRDDHPGKGKKADSDD